jgi:hypothetical protein
MPPPELLQAGAELNEYLLGILIITTLPTWLCY